MHLRKHRRAANLIEYKTAIHWKNRADSLALLFAWINLLCTGGALCCFCVENTCSNIKARLGCDFNCEIYLISYILGQPERHDKKLRHPLSLKMPLIQFFWSYMGYSWKTMMYWMLLAWWHDYFYSNRKFIFLLLCNLREKKQK